MKVHFVASQMATLDQNWNAIGRLTNKTWYIDIYIYIRFYTEFQVKIQVWIGGHWEPTILEVIPGERMGHTSTRLLDEVSHTSVELGRSSCLLAASRTPLTLCVQVAGHMMTCMPWNLRPSADPPPG